MECVILVGGRGKRLGKLTKTKPKPMIDIGGIPFLDHLIFYIAKFNISKIILLGQYKIEQIKKRYDKKAIFNIPIEVISEKKAKDTAGCLFEIKKKIKNNFLLLNGDSFLNINLDNFIKNFNSKKFLMKMSLIKNVNYLSNKKLSLINLNKKNIVYLDKKKSKLMNAGVYLINKKVLKLIKNQKLSLENDLIKTLISKQQVEAKLYKKTFFIDIGLKKNLLVAKKKLKFFTKNKGVLFDRDGVLNEDKGYIHKVKDFNILKGVEKGIKFLNKNKFIVTVVTNQSGIGRGYYTKKNLENLHVYFNNILKKHNAEINKFYFCPFHEIGGIGKYKKKSFYRKPNPGMLLEAIKNFNLNKKKCFMIGDKISDKVAANRAKVRFFYKKNIPLDIQLKQIINHLKL